MADGILANIPVQASERPKKNAPKDRVYGKRYADEWGSIPPNDLPYKGNGFYGLLPRKDQSNSKSSEISIGVTIGGKNFHVPSMVPGLNQNQLNYLLTTPEDKLFAANPELMRSIQDNAVNWAKYRMQRGLPVFAMDYEEGMYQPIK